MILNRLIIYSRSSESVKKEYIFNKVGLNIILGSKSDIDDSNGVGKSSMVDSIRYILGSRIPNDLKNRKKIIDEEFMLILEVQLKGKSIYLGRIVNKENKGYICKQDTLTFNLDNWEGPIADKEYKSIVENIILGNNEKEEHPSFASIRDYVIRDEKEGFNDIILPKRKAIASYEILDYLFQIEFKGERDILDLKKEEEDLETRLKAIEVLSVDITEMRVMQNKLKSDIDGLVDISNSLDVSKNIELVKNDYNNLKKEYNGINTKIIKLETMKQQFKENVDSLKNKVDQIKELDDIREFYSQTVTYFPEQISKNYDEIKSYYEFMVNSRGKYFGDKVEEINNILVSLYDRKKLVSKEIDKKLNMLKSTTIVDDINSILDKISEKNQELAIINAKIDQYSEKDKIVIKINEIKQKIIEQTHIKHDIYTSYEKIIKEAQAQFSSLVNYTYQESGILDFEFNSNTNRKNNTGRIKISCKIEDENSHGRMNMKVNMFDLTWFIQRIKYNQNIQFLIHDGSYVKATNKKAKFRLLTYIDDMLKNLKSGQYFVTLNIDEIDNEDLEFFKINKNVIALLSKDREEDRFMGIKYV
ncbi:MAG: DUF2326 domain-containing protein [Peptostreptococcaceae bacterium]